MTLFVDTSVWSLAFRRDRPTDRPEVRALQEALLGADQVATTGIVVQELLQGFTGPSQRDRLLDRMRALPLIRPTLDDHVEAADLRNRCRRRGVQLATIDALLAAICVRYELTLLSTDDDFVHAARVVPLHLWSA